MEEEYKIAFQELNENTINLKKNNEKLQKMCEYLENLEKSKEPLKLFPMSVADVMKGERSGLDLEHTTQIFLEIKNDKHKKLVKIQLSDDIFCILEDNHYGIGKLSFMNATKNKINIPQGVCLRSIDKITKNVLIVPKTTEMFCICWEKNYELEYLNKTYKFINQPCWDIIM